jgi:hypothetical protein
MNEHILTTYIRTKNVFKHRLKDLKSYDNVKIYVYELDKLGCNNGPLLYKLRERGEIWYDTKGNFRATKEGPIDPKLLDLTKRHNKVNMPLSKLHLWMRDLLLKVSLPGVPKKNIPVYFKAFLDHRSKSLSPFFSVDSFSNRVHSPVVNLKGDLRQKLRLDSSKITSLDVKQMQPTILAKVLEDSIGTNSFSDAIFKGEDVYIHIQKEAKLESRDAAKKYFFELIFGKPKSEIGGMFKGSNNWVEWINDYKSKEEKLNPHKEHTHTNLAWLLQYSEVQVMTDIWQKLMDENIPFLSIHDELLCKVNDKERVRSIMSEELSKHFREFTINVIDL